MSLGEQAGVEPAIIFQPAARPDEARDGRVLGVKMAHVATLIYPINSFWWCSGK